MATAFVDVVSVRGVDSVVGSLPGPLLSSSKCSDDAASINVQFTPHPTKAPPLLLSDVKAAGQHKTDVRVTQKQGYFCHIEASILVELPPERVYDVLTHPENHQIFKAQKECTYRKVLADDGEFMAVEVEHAAAWNFLFLSGTFHTRLRVEQSQTWGKVSFHLLKSTVLNKFDGEWSMVGVVATPESGRPTHTLLRLRQDMLPTIIPPPPADRLFRRLLGKQIETMFGQIQEEAKNIHKGTPALSYPPDQYVHINADPHPHTASLSRPRSRADLPTAGRGGSLSHALSRPDITPTATASTTPTSLSRPSSHTDIPAAGKTSLSRPGSHADVTSPRVTSAAPLPRPGSRANVTSTSTTPLSRPGSHADIAGAASPRRPPLTKHAIDATPFAASAVGPTATAAAATDAAAAAADAATSSDGGAAAFGPAAAAATAVAAPPAAGPAGVPRRGSVHAHLIILDEQELEELELELEDLDWEDDAESVVFYDCMDEAESLQMLVSRAGSSGLHFQDGGAWLMQRQESIREEGEEEEEEEEDGMFVDAQEELCVEQRA